VRTPQSEAGELRDRAERYRQMTVTVGDEKARKALKETAADLERQAAALEISSQHGHTSKTQGR
jgi:hypothetical protein